MTRDSGAIQVFRTPSFQTPGLPRLTVAGLELEDARTVAYAAEGYSRATGRPAILATRGRIEALHTASAVPVSWGDRIPLVVVNILAASDVEPVRVTYGPAVRGSVVMESGEDVPAVVARLENAARRGFPVQLLAAEGVDVVALLDALSCMELPQEAASAPREEDVEKISEALGPLRRPVLLLGQEGVRSSDFKRVATLAAQIRCPVLLTATAASLTDRVPLDWQTFAPEIPLIANPNAVWALTLLRADGILALGTDLSESDLFGLHDVRLPRGQVFCVSGRPVNRRGRAEEQIGSDPGLFLEALLGRLECRRENAKSRSREKWLCKTEKAVRKLRRLTVQEADRVRDQRPLDPATAAFLIEVRSQRRADTIFLAEGNGAAMWLRSFLGLRPIVFPVLMGSIGVAIPWAAGVRFGRPNHPVWGVLGDGAFLFQHKVLRTLERLNEPVVLFVLNDSCWNSIQLEQTFVFRGRYVGTDLPRIDFAELAKLHGCEGRSARDRSELHAALDEALRWSDTERRPLVVDVEVEKGSVPFAGIAFAVAELDHIWGPMWLSMLTSFAVSAARGKLPWRNIVMLIRLLF